MPASIALAKPGTAINNAAGAINNDEVALVDGVFNMHLSRARLGFRTTPMPSTGDGDSVPVVSVNEFLDGQCIFQGWMRAEIAVNIADILDLTHNPSATLNTVLTLATGLTLAFTIIVEAISFNWEFEAPFVGVTIEARKTLAGTDTSDDFVESP